MDAVKELTLTFIGLLLQNLAGSLVLKLVILTQEILAVMTPEDAAAVAPHLSNTYLLSPLS